MTTLKWLQLTGIFLAAVGLTLGYSLAGLWQWGFFFAAIGLAWWFGHARAWHIAPALGLTAYTCCAAVGTWLKASPILMLVATALSLCAWDLCEFEKRVGEQPAQTLFEQHLRRLAIVVILGTVGAVLGMSLRVKLGFWLVVCLGVLLAFTLNRAFILIGARRTAEEAQNDGEQSVRETEASRVQPQ